MNAKDEKYFQQEKQRLNTRIKQAKACNADDLADLQAERMELAHDEGVHRFFDSLED